VIPLSWSLDHVGPICKTVEDAALMLDAIAGYDDSDPTSVDTPVAGYARAIHQPVSKLRIGIVRAPFFEALDPEVQKAMDAAIDVLRKHAASASDVTLPAAAGLTVLGPEAYAYHSKWIVESPALYQAPTRAILQRSADVKASIYAGDLRKLYQLRRDVKKVFSNVDVLITPTMPAPPVTIAQSATQSAPTRNTAPFDVFGLPTVSVPCGFTSSGLPIGLQISGAPFAEPTVFSLAQAYEQATDWHKRRPSLNPA